MSNPPAPELTPADRLIAHLVGLSQGLPGGYQVALGIRLGQSIEAADELFTAHNLPMREQLVAELTYWRCHVEEGMKFLEHSEQIIRAAMETVSPSPQRR